MFIAASFTIAKIWKQPKRPSIEEWIKKMWCIYTVGIILSELSETEKGKYHMISLICGFLKTNEKTKQTHKFREQTGSHQRRGG